ncbi:HVO_0476 family zinc finger protein [Halomicrococcus sp. NG-SE-24]|uniref:HVO_0476 family zinc finger protein n=1 Tax=Halomicrococcus sp. NG-SE-24 TaxID=3436928 RepID=UPI003D959AD8
MTETTERVAAACPSCSPDVETVHEVLKPGGQTTVRCTECGHVHKTRIEEPETTDTGVVVSQDGESFSAREEVPVGEELAVGEEFVLETEEAIMVVRITSLELDGDRRVEEATAEDVETIWTRAVDNVTVKVTLHPKEGSYDDSRSIKVDVPGDYEFVVGETAELGDEEFAVDGILVADDAVGYDIDKLDRDGDDLVAKDVKRVYGTDKSSSAWSAW